MSSPLKRKCNSDRGLTAAAASPTSSSARNSPALPSRSSEAFAHPFISAAAGGSNNDGDMRTQLQHSLRELQSSSSRIESILRQLAPSPSRSALTEVTAPAQRPAHTSLSAAPIPPTDPLLTKQPPAPSRSEGGCPRCLQLHEQVAALQATVAAHEREREAWKAFKSWWLASLSKREKKRRRPSPSTAVGRKVTSRDKLDAVVNRLDPQTKAVWQRAGVIPSDLRASADAGAVLPDGETDDVAGRSRDEGLESAGQHSEPTLPLHLPSAPGPESPHRASPKPAQKSTTSTTASASKPPPIAPSSTTTTARPSAAATVGHIDDTPVRNRHMRRTMLAHDCPECEQFYARLNELGDPHHDGNHAWGDRERSACSRHRTTYARASTPEGYWDIAFPSTQHAEEVNAHARSRRPPPPQKQ